MITNFTGKLTQTQNNESNKIFHIDYEPVGYGGVQ
jgi:hypothetical protein